MFYYIVQFVGFKQILVSLYSANKLQYLASMLYDSPTIMRNIFGLRM